MFCIKPERLLGPCPKHTGDIERLSLAKDGDNWTSKRIMPVMVLCKGVMYYQVYNKYILWENINIGCKKCKGT